ncbi:o-succinylbenzoate--CoA ligase [Nitrolancea hollandica]|uniref:2-succinylbenzoate--CoA ligase n=1 Tax=Nitrolancea hollandica Lb TaxID=1129897 RepID=I4EJK0_9BACT|nr:o-succinylbenzoate--CoA ligase [Nitrolancea hollandica]CCF84862.1 O-succinylbenzoic acid-CoA ligase [Nitrolancea hollandica Lb]
MQPEPERVLATDSIPDWLRHRAATSPDRPAILAGAERWTFDELDKRVSRTARRLAGLGVRPGDRVATLLRNSHQAVEVIHAVGRIGAVLVPLNFRLTAGEIAWQLADVNARLLVSDAYTAVLAGEAAHSLPKLARAAISGESPDANPLNDAPELDVPLRERIALDDPHSIIYTSGTTGQPKGVLLSYGNHWWSAIGSALNLGTHQDDCWLACLPLFHVGGLAILMRSLICGIPAVIHESFDPAAVNRSIDEDGVTIISVVSTMLRRMLTARGERPYPPALRCVLLGGGPAPRDLLDTCARRAIPVVQTYGLTETASQVATLAPADALRKLGSAGKPLFPNEVRIDRDGSALPPGEPGEILVRGPVVTRGYAGRPDATARALRDGWLHTGDLGYLDPDGYLYVLDRRDDLIITGGENVYPAEVEAALLAQDGIEDAGVIGVPDPEWGQAVVAAVRLANGITLKEEQIRAACRARLAGYKVPVQIRFIDTLPRNAGGKLSRRALRSWWLEGASEVEPAAGDGADR